MVFLQVAVGCQGEYGGRPRVFCRAVAGIAAVWYGGPQVAMLKHFANLESCQRSACRRPSGAMDSTCAPPVALLIEHRTWIDHPSMATPSQPRCALRAHCGSTANDRLQRHGAGQLGRGLLCSDAIHAQRCGPRPPRLLCVRVHAEHDLCCLGQSVKGHSRKVVIMTGNPVCGRIN